ncbi:MAG: carbohydrate ABC transporter substrate-binding protein [Salinibacterium sp.]|nr:ABC transporter substrate-binding protein [Salinibacterium sp.]MBF0673213.1 carbohydrate ABC transporter substrate-binding protein [Salinibacterium sp.]
MHTAHRRRGLTAVALAGAAGLVLAGCTSGGAGGGGDADCSDYEQYGTFDNASVEVYATIIDVEADQLVESWADFEECTGITIDYVGTQEAETQINVRVAAGDAPDIMIVPQPGLLQRLIGDGAVVPASAEVEANVDEFWSESWKGYGSVDGTFYAAPLMASVKGYIWYSPADFEENGYEVPETWDDLVALTEEMADNNDSQTYRPWCVGFGSGDATGWPGTDWIEDLVLRMHGPEAYDQWVAGELPFSSPEIQEAFDAAGEILLNPDFVNGGFGGVESINSTTFQDAGLAILDGNCSLHHQASFYEAQWGEDVEVAEDGDVWAFITPKVDADAGDSVTGGGEFVAAFTDNEETDAVQQYLSSDTWANIRVGLGGVISANNGVDPSVAGSEIGAQSMEILQGEDTVFRFDGSDLMPAAVGTSSFWTGIVDWVGGDSTSSVTARIDASYPR